MQETVRQIGQHIATLSTVDSFAPLASVTRLVNLCITNTNFTDGDTAAFQTMKSLRYVFWMSAPEGGHPEELGEMLAATGRTEIVSLAALMNESTPESKEISSCVWEEFAIGRSF